MDATVKRLFWSTSVTVKLCSVWKEHQALCVLLDNHESASETLRVRTMVGLPNRQVLSWTDSFV